MPLRWRACTARLAPRERWLFALLALAFPYYRFAFSNLAEGLFVGVPAVAGVLIGTELQRRISTRAISLVFSAMLVVVAMDLLLGLSRRCSSGWRQVSSQGGSASAAGRCSSPRWRSGSA